MNIASRVLMVRPVRFGFNEQTAASNSFQSAIAQLTPAQVQALALAEFDNFVHLLRNQGVEVWEEDDTAEPHTPDSIFPNNWLQTTPDGHLFTFPMQSPNRQQERREDIIDALVKKHHYSPIRNLETYEKKGLHLEGTGSMALDYRNRTIFAALSPRTCLPVLQDYAAQLGFDYISFDAKGKAGEAIYHTNVMLGVADDLAWVGLDTIPDEQQKAQVLSALQRNSREVLQLSNEQIYQHFAGNMLALANTNGERFLVVSTSAFAFLFDAQKQLVAGAGYQLFPIPIPIIERVGGGSVRCMLAELF